MPVGDLSFRAMSGHSATFSPLFNKIYVFGGFDGKTTFNDMWIFDIESEYWLKL